MTLTVAIEGPSDSGKSTLMAGLEKGFSSVEPQVFPCYVDEAGGSEGVPPLAESELDQMSSLDFYLEIEAGRHRRLGERDHAPRLVLLDRSVFTLLAHSYAVERTQGLSVYERSRQKMMTGAEVIIPSIVLYLDAPVEERDRRAEPGDREEWFTNNRFNSEIRAFFLKRFQACAAGSELHVLDAGRPAAAVLEDAARIVSSSLP